MRTHFQILTLSSLVCLLTVWSGSSLPPQSSGFGRKYRLTERLQPERLRATSQARQQLTRMRRLLGNRTGLQDYKAILHAHAEDAAHTGGTRPELLAAAKRTGVRIMMLTDHVRPHRDFINDSWRGLRESVLFIPGAEAEGFLVYPQQSIKGRTWQSRDEYISLIRKDKGNIFLSHIEERPDWPTDQLDGMEIYNLHTDFKDEQVEFARWLSRSVSSPERLTELQKLMQEYPLEILGSAQDYLAPIIAKWDRDSLQHRVCGIAANDCHHNQVITLKAGAAGELELWLFSDDSPLLKITPDKSPDVAALTRGKQPGETIATLDFDPYERSLTYVSTHILTNRLTETAVRNALNQAHAYVAHDWLCDPTGFAYLAASQSRTVGVMGDEIAFAADLELRVVTTVKGIIRLFRNGELVQEAVGDSLNQPVDRPGVYRVEVWLEVAGEQRPWIYANPIRIGM